MISLTEEDNSGLPTLKEIRTPKVRLEKCTQSKPLFLEPGVAQRYRQGSVDMMYIYIYVMLLCSWCVNVVVS